MDKSEHINSWWQIQNPKLNRCFLLQRNTMPYFHCDPYLIIPHSYRPIQWMTLLTFFLSRRSDQIMSRISLCPHIFLLYIVYLLTYTHWICLIRLTDIFIRKKNPKLWHLYTCTNTNLLNLMVILLKRICVNILILPLLIQFIHVGYRLF